jgi:hypothetical protein
MSERRDTLGRRIGNAGVPRNTRERAGALDAKRAVLGTHGVLGNDARTAVAYAWCERCAAYHVAPYRARTVESYVPRDRNARWPLRVAAPETVREARTVDAWDGTRDAWSIGAARAARYNYGRTDTRAARERERVHADRSDDDAPQHVAHTCPPVKRDATRHDAPRYGAPAAHAGTCTREHANDAQRAACDRIRDAARRHRVTVYRDTVTRIALRDGVCVHA